MSIGPRFMPCERLCILFLALLGIGCSPGTPPPSVAVPAASISAGGLSLEELQDQQEIAEWRAKNRRLLFDAVEAGNAVSVSELLDDPLGVDLSSVNDEGLTAREIALHDGHSAIVQLLSLPEPLVPIENVGSVYYVRGSDRSLHAGYWIEATLPAESWLKKLYQRMETLGYKPLPLSVHDRRHATSQPRGWFSYSTDLSSFRMTHQWSADWESPDETIVSVTLMYRDSFDSSVVPVKRSARDGGQAGDGDTRRLSVSATLRHATRAPIETLEK